MCKSRAFLTTLLSVLITFSFSASGAVWYVDKAVHRHRKWAELGGFAK
jgi:hypothetical protein